VVADYCRVFIRLGQWNFLRTLVTTKMFRFTNAVFADTYFSYDFHDVNSLTTLRQYQYQYLDLGQSHRYLLRSISGR
jgi:hypothetical protein